MGQGIESHPAPVASGGVSQIIGSLGMGELVDAQREQEQSDAGEKGRDCGHEAVPKVLEIAAIWVGLLPQQAPSTRAPRGTKSDIRAANSAAFIS